MEFWIGLSVGMHLGKVIAEYLEKFGKAYGLLDTAAAEKAECTVRPISENHRERYQKGREKGRGRKLPELYPPEKTLGAVPWNPFIIGPWRLSKRYPLDGSPRTVRLPPWPVIRKHRGR